jgi:uncharacterized protein
MNPLCVKSMPIAMALLSMDLLSAAIAKAETTRSADASTDAAKAAAVARAFVGKLSAGDATGAEESFDGTMRVGFPSDKLSGLWGGLEKKLGPFQAIEKVNVKSVQSMWAAFVFLQFARGRAVLRVVVNPKGQIAGLWQDRVEPDWKPPAYVSADQFIDRPVTVGSKPPLPGHLTIPIGKGPFPIAILVHGSGPGDEDETIGPNKPFKDLALGLGSKGVAVLRYDKRTHVPPMPSPNTVQAEYFSAVADAIALSRAATEIDPRRVVLLGHSQGAQLAPWLAKENPGLAGIVLLAPPIRSPLESAITQLEQVHRLHPENHELAAKLTALKQDGERVQKGTLDPDEVVFYAPGTYWASLRGYDPVATAAGLSLAIFVAQGERDANVSPTVDYSLWQNGLAKKANVTFRLYPNLNHLFIAWGGTPSVEDNAHPGHVDETLVNDLATWIRGLKAAK